MTINNRANAVLLLAVLILVVLDVISIVVDAASPAPLSMPKYRDGTEYALNNPDIKNILEQNEEYINSMGKDFFEDLGSKHEPKYMWIGCADARVPANELMGEKPGSVFVARNIANMVVATDVNLMSALQYAVTVLQVKHIIICGHYECGGIRASMTGKDVGPPLEMWLRNIRDVYRTHKDELDAIEDPEDRHRRMVEINAVEQGINLFKTGVVQNWRVKTRNDPTCKFPAPTIHVVVYDPKNGRLKKLDINWDEYLDEIGGVYEMYADDNGGKGGIPALGAADRLKVIKNKLESMGIEPKIDNDEQKEEASNDKEEKTIFDPISRKPIMVLKK